MSGKNGFRLPHPFCSGLNSSTELTAATIFLFFYFFVIKNIPVNAKIPVIINTKNALPTINNPAQNIDQKVNEWLIAS